MKNVKTSVFATAIISSLLLSACSEDKALPDTPSEPEANTNITLDSDESTAYLNLITGTEVESTQAWHISVNRLNVSLNNNVEAALGDAQDEFYDAPNSPNVSVFTNATADSEANALYNLVSDSGLTFHADELKYAITDWYIYNFSNHTVSPNTDSNWLIHSAEATSYAKMRVAEIVQNGREFTTSFTFDVQAVGEAAFSGSTSSTFTISNQAVKTCFDFDAGTTADCTGNTWDIGMDAGEVILNGGDSAADSGNAQATGPILAVNLADYTAGTNIPLVAYKTDLMAGMFADNTWYAYGLLERHQIWPNYRVYVIDTDTTSTDDELIKVQLINYYDESGVSGNVTVRLLPLSATE